MYFPSFSASACPMLNDVMLRIVSTVRFLETGTGPELNCQLILGCGLALYGISMEIDWPSFSTMLSLKSSSFSVGGTVETRHDSYFLIGLL